MSLPSTCEYTIPDCKSWPSARVDWALEPSSCALLVHDMQSYFLAPYSESLEPLCTCLPNVAQLRRLAARARVATVFSAQPAEQSREARGLLWEFWGPGLGARQDLSGFPSVLHVGSEDTILVKSRYSAFFETHLLEQLRAQKCSQLLIVGVYGHIGCLATAVDAFMLGFRPFLVGDAIADFTAEDHAIAIRQVQRVCGRVLPTVEVADRFAASLVRKAAAQLLDCREEELLLHETLADQGLDSVRAVSLVEAIFERPERLEYESIVGATTLVALARLVVEEVTREVTEELAQVKEVPRLPSTHRDAQIASVP